MLDHLIKAFEHIATTSLEITMTAATLTVVKMVWSFIRKRMISAKMVIDAISADHRKYRRVLAVQIVLDFLALAGCCSAIASLVLDDSPVSKSFVFITCLLFLAIANTWVQLDRHLTDYRSHKP